MSLLERHQAEVQARLQRAAEQRQAIKRPATHRCRACGKHVGPDDVSNIGGAYHGGDQCPCGEVENFEPLNTL